MATLAAPYLSVAQRALEMLIAPQTLDRWKERSVLEGYDVAGLAAHLSRGILTVATYLDQPAPPGATLVSAVDYYVIALADHDPVHSPMHRSVRARASELGAQGPAALVAEAAGALHALTPRLHSVEDDFAIVTFGDLALTVHEYLKTRLVELTAHLDDLAQSVALAPPEVPDAAGECVVATLAEYARRRHGTLAVVRALARRERASGPIVAF